MDVDILLVYEEGLPAEPIIRFEQSLQSKQLNFFVQSRAPTGAMACSEWFIIPAVAIFIGSKYIEGFLTAMGADHYSSFKKKLSTLANDVMREPKFEPTLFVTEGKLNPNNPFSSAFSVMADAEDGFKFKLMIPKAMKSGDWSIIIHRFLDFLSDYNSGIESFETIGCNWNGAPPPSGIFFVYFDDEANAIRWLDAEIYL